MSRNISQFKCVGCGNCCRGHYILLTFPDIINIAHYVKEHKIELPKDKRFWNLVALPNGLVDDRVFKLVDKDGKIGWFSLILAVKDKETKECVFLKNNKCEVYPVRTFNCSLYPGEGHNLDNCPRAKLFKMDQKEVDKANKARIHLLPYKRQLDYWNECIPDKEKTLDHFFCYIGIKEVKDPQNTNMKGEKK